MFTSKDLEFRSIFVINCLEKRELRVSNGELLVKDGENDKTLTKIPFQKILALFIVGSFYITTPVLDYCKRNNVALVVMSQRFRPVFFWANHAEANFLLRKKQYLLDKDDIKIAKVLVSNKINNQRTLLLNTRKGDTLTQDSIVCCDKCFELVKKTSDYFELMGLEGQAANAFFKAYYQVFDWTKRSPRVRCDCINATLDIGYTILFNYIECFLRMFGFDLYCGVYHRLWFKRKSLVCDLMEPFRCLIDRAVRTGFNRAEFKYEDFRCSKNEYILKVEKNSHYSQVFFKVLIPYKKEIFLYVQAYYRAFMKDKESSLYPRFEL